jgi:hypothetical protein
MADTTPKHRGSGDQVINWIEQTEDHDQSYVLPGEESTALLISRYRNNTVINVSRDAMVYRSIIETLFQNHKSRVSSHSAPRPECRGKHDEAGTINEYT